jgi:uncharacterized protein YjbI with pentapeptide repeats
VDSSGVGYDGALNVREEERSVGRKALSRKPEPRRGIAWPRWTGFRGKTAWDWMQLLIVPFVLASFGLFLSTSLQNVRQSEILGAQQMFDQQQASYAVLQAYTEDMKGLLLDEGLRSAGPDSNARAVARVETLTAFSRLGGEWESYEEERIALQFLYDASLIRKDRPIVDLTNVSLKYGDLRDIDLSASDLSAANLSGANLSSANMSGAVLKGADLSGWSWASTNLSDADLSGADLSDAVLLNTDLSNAVLNKANLSGAKGITNEELERQAKSLEGATMPNGQKYEDWLKASEKRQQDE